MGVVFLGVGKYAVGMRKYFAYVVVEVIPGDSHATFCVECSDPAVSKAEINNGGRALAYFFQNGWEPLREGPFSAQSAAPHAYSLLVLSRDISGS
jgi:hypothetical protein